MPDLKDLPPADRFGPRGARCFNVQVDAATIAGLTGPERPLGRVAAEGGRPAVAAARLRGLAGGDRLAGLKVEALVLELLEAVKESRGGADEKRGAPAWLGRVIERLVHAGERVHQAVSRRLVSKFDVYFGFKCVVGNVDQQLVRIRTLRGFVIVGGHSLVPNSFIFFQAQ